MSTLSPKQEAMSEQSSWDFSDLRALFINCTLKRSPERSHTDGLSAISMEIMRRQGVAVEEVRATIGRRLVAHLSGGKCPECAEEVKAVRASMVAATLGKERLVDELGINLMAWTEDAASGFTEVLCRQFACHPQSARLMQEVLELHALATIYEERVGLPAGFIGRVKALMP